MHILTTKMQEQNIIQSILQRNSARYDNHPQPDTALADSLFYLPDTLGPSADDLLWTLSFEILEVYPGSRFPIRPLQNFFLAAW